jgi:hypothetical protein
MDKPKDIAGDSFLARWPDWLRWVLFIPAALLCSLLISGIFFLINTSFNDVREGSFLYYQMDIMRTGLLGALFVFIGAYVAPKHQFTVAVILAGIGAMFGGVALLAILQNGAHLLSNVLSIGALLAGVIYTVVAIKEQTD